MAQDITPIGAGGAGATPKSNATQQLTTKEKELFDKYSEMIADSFGMKLADIEKMEDPTARQNTERLIYGLALTLIQVRRD